jgi:hypothetical protein
MKADPDHFINPRPGYVACFELTPAGKRWAESLLVEAEDGGKPWLVDPRK